VDHLSEHGVTVHWQCEFLRAEQTGEGVYVYYKDATGNEMMMTGEYLVGCDGAHSLVRHAMGASFPGDTVPKLFYVADVKLSSTIIHTDELFMFLIQKGFILFFPMEGAGHYRVIGILPDGTAEDTAITFDDIEASVKAQVKVPLEFEAMHWYSMYKVHSRAASAFMQKRFFIAGDAGHIHTPAGGQGMNTGLQDVYNLAWKLALVIEGKMNAAVLETYNSERLGNAKNLLRSTDRIFDIMSGSNWFWNFIRLRIFPVFAKFISRTKRFNKRIFPLISQTSIAYPDSALTVRSAIGKVSSGDRMHYFVFADGRDIFSYLHVPVFKILFFGNSDDQFDRIITQNLPLQCLSFREIPRDVFGNSNDFYILLRPDNHVSYIGDDLKLCIEFLKGLGLNLSGVK
jgi:2-polyprenyl-6-methoxyphenol hydroxylase-like FAD-dependent oxidoreductase